MFNSVTPLLFFLFFFLLFSSLNVTFVTAGDLNRETDNNILPKHHSPDLPKESPLSAVYVADFAKLPAQNNRRSLFGFFWFQSYGPYGDIAKRDINYINYGSNHFTTPPPAQPSNSLVNKHKLANKVEPGDKGEEPGRFFRECKLKEGTVMPMPDIKDKMPKTSFLSQEVVSKLPFSSSQFSVMKEMFNASDNSALERIIKLAVEDCERKPNPGEIKRCLRSAEEMKYFAESVLGLGGERHETESDKGSKQDILIGEVEGFEGGKVTKAVSCHRMLFPYKLYYCHSVPEVRVYEADILDPKTKNKINHAMAICHLDTSTWSPGHEAFGALDADPGQIEVCHWIFQGDYIWTSTANYH